MSEKENCSFCTELSMVIARHGFKPTCKKNKLRFKEQTKGNWYSKQLMEGSCNKFKEHEI